MVDIGARAATPEASFSFRFFFFFFWKLKKVCVGSNTAPRTGLLRLDRTLFLVGM